MAEFTQFKGYPKDYAPKVPKPAVSPEPVVLNAQQGVPVVYPGCYGVGIRVVHPVNPVAPAKNLGLVLFYLPPHVPHSPRSFAAAIALSADSRAIVCRTARSTHLENSRLATFAASRA